MFIFIEFLKKNTVLFLWTSKLLFGKYKELLSAQNLHKAGIRKIENVKSNLFIIKKISTYK